jgi:hypothetical protein
MPLFGGRFKILLNVTFDARAGGGATPAIVRAPGLARA